ncbi:MAG: hypothetical protein GX318_01525, partial [Clostridia bacterium]|nr:hypothetical protein [Clostridia bacterium]
GNIKIVSGTDIQITAESNDAKIEGTVSIESNAKTTISAPVSNLVVNTKNSQVVINATVDKVALRYNAEITLNIGVETPRIEARLGTTVTAKNENGEQVAVDVNYTLDTYELRLKINGATNRLENIVEGPYDGNVAEGEREKLQTALTNSEQALENKEVTEQNQKDIDAAAETLGQAIADFDSKIVKVNRREINQLVEYVYLFKILNYSGIVIGTEVGNYPQEAYNEFKTVFDETREYLRGDKVTQSGVNSKLEQLENALVTFNASKITTPDTRGIAQFLIIGDNIESWEIKDRYISVKKPEDSKWDYMWDLNGEKAIEVTQNTSGLSVNIEFDVLDKYEEFVIPIELNGGGYLAFLNITAQEIKNKNVKEISLDSFASIDVSIAGEENHGNYILYNLSADGMYNHYIDKNVKIQPGTYSISYKLKETDIPYYLYTDPIELNGEDKGVVYSKDDFVEVELKLAQKHPYSYTINSVSIIKHGTGSPIEINNNAPKLYLSKGLYKSISPYYVVDINGSEYQFNIGGVECWETGFEVNQDTAFDFSDDFSLKSGPEGYEYVITDKSQKLSKFGHFQIENDLEQQVHFHDKGAYLDMNCHIKITANDKEYTGDAFLSDLTDLTFGEIFGEDDLEEEFTLEIGIPELPIISPYIQKIKFDPTK